MSTGPRKDASTPEPEKASADSPDALLTSQDLFGDLIDAPLETEKPATGAAGRSAPIRVQVSEGGEAGPPKPKAPDVLPEDMAALLDAFGDAPAAPDEPAAGPPSAPESAQATVEARAPVASAAPAGPAAPATPPAAHAAAAPRTASPLDQSDEEDLSGLLEGLEAPTPEAADPVPEPAIPVASLPPEPEPAVAALAQEAEAAPPPASAPAAEEEEVALDDLLGDLAEPDPEHTLVPGMLSAPLADIIAGRDPEKTIAPGKMKAPVFDVPMAPPAAAKVEAPEPPKTPAPARRPLVPTDLDSLLEDVLAPAVSTETKDAVVTEEKVPEIEKPAARLGTKFAAAEPKIGASGESRMMLDLAGLAEDAFTLPAPPPRGSEAGGTKQGVGDIYGPYHLVEKVASGGMAEVFRAKRAGVEGFEKVLAVKRILPHLSDNKEFVDMFIEEAKMVAGLTHPSIVQIFDLGKIERTYFIAMEYIHGRDLRTILRRAKDKGIRIPLDLSVLVVSRVCSALEYAHRKKDESGRALKIVHRDISPQNILISFEGDVKLTDFGIAKATSKATSTDKGALRGKLLYMSPEQAWGKPMDRRSDVFSLGLVFYEMITDRKPFLGTSEKGILEMVRECQIAAPSTLNPRVPERLEKVVLKALEREPDQRYQDAGEMLRDLERALHERQPPTAIELARFMEVLFEHEERGEQAPHEAGHDSDKHRVEGNLEIDMGPEEEAAPKPPQDQLGIGKLLKKFGIK